MPPKKSTAARCAVVLWGMISEYRRLRNENFKWITFPIGNAAPVHNKPVMMLRRRGGIDCRSLSEFDDKCRAVSLAEVRTERLVAAHAAIEVAASTRRRTAASFPRNSPTSRSRRFRSIPRPQALPVRDLGNTGTIKSDAPAGKNPEYFALHFELTIIPRDASSAK